MDRQRRESKDDGGTSRERRRSRSPEGQRRTHERSRRDSPIRSRSKDQNRNPKANDDTTDRKESNNEARHKDSSREKSARDRDRKMNSNSTDPEGGTDGGRAQSRNDNGGREVQGSGRADSSSSRRDESGKKEDSTRRDCNGKKGDEGRSSSKRSRSPPRNESKSRESDTRGTRVDSSRNSASLSRDQRSADASAIKASNSGAIDDSERTECSEKGHDDRREKRNRRGDDSRVEDYSANSEIPMKADENRRDSRDKVREETNSMEASKSGSREKGSMEKARTGDARTGEARVQSVEDRYGPSEVAEREAARERKDGRQGGDGRGGGRGRGGRDDRGDKSQIYRPRGGDMRMDEFPPSQQWREGPYGATGRGSMDGRGLELGRGEYGGDGVMNQDHMAGYANDMNIWGDGGGMAMGMGMGMGSASIQRINGQSDWECREREEIRQRGGSVGSSDRFNDWQQQQHHPSFPSQGTGLFQGSGPANGFYGDPQRRPNGFPGAGDFSVHPPSGDFNDQLWGWDRGQQNRNAEMKGSPSIPKGGGVTDCKVTQMGSHVGPGPPQFKGRTQPLSSGFKPPPPPLPPKLLGVKDTPNISDSIRESVRGYVNDAMKTSVMENATPRREDRKVNNSINAENTEMIESPVCTIPSDDSSNRSKNRKTKSGIIDEVEPEPVQIDVNVEVSYVLLKWALEDMNVLVSRRLAGEELYGRVLALRDANAIKDVDSKVESSEDSEEAQSHCDIEIKSQNQNQNQNQDNGQINVKDNKNDTTLEDMLASITKSNDENAVDGTTVSIDDFFGAFAVTGAIPGMAGDGDEGIRKDDEMDVDLASLITAAGVADDDDDDDDVVADSDGDGDDMYGDLGDEGAIDEPEEEGEKDIEDLHKDLGTEDSTTSGVKEKSLEDSGAATVTDVFRASNLNPLIARDYHLPPPNFLEDIPYVAQDLSFTRLNLFSKALKGQGFSTFLLQSLPDLQKLFWKENRIKKW